MSLPDLLAPVRSLVEALLVVFHHLLDLAGLDPASGLTWALSVALLVALIRAALLPVAVRQHRSALRMRALAPELARLRDRHRGRVDSASRQRLGEETAALYRRHGFHPLGALLPIVIQLPLFIALVQALEHAAHATGPAALASFATAAVFGVPLAVTTLHGGLPAAVVGGALLLVTAAAQMLTQHLVAAGTPPVAGGRLLLLLPLLTAAAGLAFPIGVLVYWACSALWTLGQQLVLPRFARIA